tara:strand:- start:78 stop:314 length:237 start_codon:yes stop_codon:yes gene_type:complete
VCAGNIGICANPERECEIDESDDDLGGNVETRTALGDAQFRTWAVALCFETQQVIQFEKEKYPNPGGIGYVHPVPWCS